MRRLFLAPALAVLLGACGGSQPYSSEDLHQVRYLADVLMPTYSSFKAAYLSNNLSVMTADFRREQSACKIADRVDRRDTIDPSVRLFQASEGVDNLCNAIEYAYASWRRDHHLPWDHTLNLGPEPDLFRNSDVSLNQMPEDLANPAAQTP